MTYIGEDADINIVCKSDCKKSELVRFVFLHADHDIISADSPMNLEIGFSCIDCDTHYSSRMSQLKLGEDPFADEFIRKLMNKTRTQEQIKSVVAEYPQYSKRLEKIKCFL